MRPCTYERRSNVEESGYAEFRVADVHRLLDDDRAQANAPLLDVGAGVPNESCEWRHRKGVDCIRQCILLARPRLDRVLDFLIVQLKDSHRDAELRLVKSLPLLQKAVVKRCRKPLRVRVRWGSGKPPIRKTPLRQTPPTATHLSVFSCQRRTCHRCL